jgi:hemerythrin
MKKHSKALIYAAIIGLIIVAIFLGFLSGMNNPISWILILALLLIPFIYNKTKSDTQLKWKEEYSVNIEVLDLDHKKLINLLNQFNTAYDYAMSEEFERQALCDLIDYTKYHFNREEKIMLDNDYPDFESHKQQHQDMIQKISQMEDKYNEKGQEVCEEVCEFLTNWLINHINGTDKQYSQHLNSRGIK